MNVAETSDARECMIFKEKKKHFLYQVSENFGKSRSSRFFIDDKSSSEVRVKTRSFSNRHGIHVLI